MRRADKKELNPQQLAVRLLGRFEARRDGILIPDEAWGRRKTETLLKVLLTKPGTVFSQDQLIEALFGEEDVQKALRNLYGRVSQLRRALEPKLTRGINSIFILRRGQGYCFDVESPCWIDTSEFLDHLAQGDEHQRNGKHLKAVEAYEEAIRLYRGEFLEADRYEEWTLEPRAEWRDRYTTALARLAEGYANLGDYHRAAIACREAFNFQPWRESVMQQLMRYHHTAGERSEALHVYERGAKALKEQLDVQPSAETETLRQQVQERTHSEVDVVRDRTRIAVLPLVNISSEPEGEYFADGMTEELIYTLSQVHELKVIAQTSVLSYKNTKKTVAQIGRELSIGTVIEGSVRKADDSVRVTIQLIDVASEEHLWARKYDRPFRDIFSIQSDIAQRVASELRVELLDADVKRIEEEPTGNLEAYTLYLKGRHFSLWIEEAVGYEKAISYFQQAIAMDPGYAVAWSGLADAQCHLWFFCSAPDQCLTDAREAADQAVKLNPKLGEGYASQAIVKWVGEKDLDAAEQLFARAIELAPRNATIRLWYSNLLSQQQRQGEALVAVLEAHEIEPLSPAINYVLSMRLRSAGRYEDGIGRLQDAIDVFPQHANARVTSATLKMAKWDWVGAEADFLEAIQQVPTSALLRVEYTELLLILGRRKEGKACLEQALTLSDDHQSAQFLEEVSRTYMFLGDFKRALQFAEKAAAAAPRIRLAYWMIGACHAMLGNYRQALDALSLSEDAIEGLYRTSRTYMQLWIEYLRGLIFARMGNPAEVQHILKNMHAFPKGLSDLRLVTALLLFEIGCMDDGFKYLKLAFDAQDQSLRQLPCWQVPQCVSEDPRYATALKQLGIPSSSGGT